ncbi:MAG TPA: DUF2865 domain-containing protein [Methylocella sp.]|nr:DUF2865 domain-containing protein [Methylocella sp.]
MNSSSGLGRAIKKTLHPLGVCLRLGMGTAAFLLSAGSASLQPLDCGRLAAEINALNNAPQRPSNHYGGAVQKQRAELDRAIANARALGCNRGQFFLFDNLPPRCAGLNAQIQQLQTSLAQYEDTGDLGGNGAARQQLLARYNAYCRGQVQTSPQQRGFFETLFGALVPNQNPSQAPQPQFEEVRPAPGEDLTPHGGSQPLCVRSCDGGFFPLNQSVRQSNPDQLAGLCQALCPNAEVSVYTRSPNQDISTAVSLDGQTAYADLPNALKFQKSFDPACTCKPPGQSWAQALGGAEELLGRARKSDIVVTPETSAELAKPKFERAARPSDGAPSSPSGDQAVDNPAAAEGQAGAEEVTGPDGVKKHVRIIVPPL